MAGYRAWQDALDDCNVPDQWDLDLEAWPKWCWPHLTPAMVDAEAALPFRVIYATLVERSGLPLASRALLHYLARRCGGPSGSPRRCWPPLDTIADRIGASRRTVQYAIKAAEDAGWLRVVRHTRAPSDYVLDVPALKACPCQECRDPRSTEVRDEEHDEAERSPEPEANGKQPGSEPLEGEGADAAPQGADSAPQGANAAPLRVQELHPQGAKSAHALGSEHLVQALDPDSLDPEHLRAPPDGATPRGPDRYRQGKQFGNYLETGQVTPDDVNRLADGLTDAEERRQFLDGVKAGAA